MREIKKVTTYTVERKTSQYYDADLKWRFTVEESDVTTATQLDMRFDGWKPADLKELITDIREVLEILEPNEFPTDG